MPKEPQSPQHVALGQTIRELRDAKGWSQERLAEEAGMDRTYVSGVERGERNVSYTNLLRISATLGLRLSELQALAEGRTDRPASRRRG